MTLKDARISAVKCLSSGPSPRLDADVILKYILDCDETFLLFHSDYELSEVQKKCLFDSLEKRKTGLPVAYITGKKEFFGYDFNITTDVLIPKPDTEILVENAINFIEDKFLAENEGRILSVCDMCSGSGCVGISILKSICEKKIIPKELLPEFTFADISLKTLEVAKKNAEALLDSNVLHHCKFIQSNLFENLGKSRNGLFDVIVSNPPYVPYQETVELLKDGRSEPALALCGDIDLNGNLSESNDGLEVIRNLVLQSLCFLNTEGILIMETGEYNAEKTELFMKENGFKDTKIFTDLEGQLRNVSGTVSKN